MRRESRTVDRAHQARSEPAGVPCRPDVTVPGLLRPRRVTRPVLASVQSTPSLLVPLATQTVNGALPQRAPEQSELVQVPAP